MGRGGEGKRGEEKSGEGRGGEDSIGEKRRGRKVGGDAKRGEERRGLLRLTSGKNRVEK